MKARGSKPAARQLSRAYGRAFTTYYRQYYPLLPDPRAEPASTQAGTVSRLCHEPRVALAVLEEMLAPYRSGRQIEVLLRHHPVAVESDGDQVVR